MRSIQLPTFLLVVSVAACSGTTGIWQAPTPLGLDAFLPPGERETIRTREVELGRRLFFDPRLSADRTVACASCHQPHLAFSDDERVSRGVFGRRGRRNAPALVNRGYGARFFLDGRAASLEEQALHPIHDSLEMALPLDELERRLLNDRALRHAFEHAFADGVSARNTARALASFVRTLRVGNTPLDRYRAGDRSALDDAARRGLELFNGRAHCSGCHSGTNFTDEDFHNTGTAVASGDPGRAAVTGEPADSGAFKTPTLRELIYTAPYMHNGGLATLDDVIDHYDRGGVANAQLDNGMRPLRLSLDEKRALRAFLRSLSSDGTASCAAAGRFCAPQRSR